MDAKPTVSVVMPCFNAKRHLPVSVGSVIAQKWVDWELIAVDDGSQDESLTWLRLQVDPRIRVVSQANQGVSSARNRGLSLARGTFIAFLDADDTWSPDFLDRMVSALRSSPTAVLAYCGWQNIGLPGAAGQPFIPPDYEVPQKRELLFAACRWPIHAALSKRAAVCDVGGFDDGLKYAEDYALWLRMGAHASIVRVPSVLAFYHFHGGEQASSRVALAGLGHLLAQERYLTQFPEFRTQLGHKRCRDLTLGRLLDLGYTCYWKRDLGNARAIFREVFRRGYGKPADWLYMLPAWLPHSWHWHAVNYRDGLSRTVSK